jgi:hypothetical protein
VSGESAAADARLSTVDPITRVTAGGGAGDAGDVTDRDLVGRTQRALTALERMDYRNETHYYSSVALATQ